MKEIVQHKVIDGKIIDCDYWERVENGGCCNYKLTGVSFETIQGEIIRYEKLAFSGFLSSHFRPGIGTSGKFFLAEVQIPRGHTQVGTVYALITGQNRYCDISDAIRSVENMTKAASHSGANAFIRIFFGSGGSGAMGGGAFVAASLSVGFVTWLLGCVVSMAVENTIGIKIPIGIFFIGGIFLPILGLLFCIILRSSGGNSSIPTMKNTLRENGFRI